MIIMIFLVFSAGMLLYGVENILKVIVNIILLLGGLYFLGLIPDFRGIELINLKFNDQPLRFAFIAGLVVGTGLGSCALAFMSPVLSISISKFNQFPIFSISLGLAFILGHC